MRKVMINVDERTFVKLQFIATTFGCSISEMLTQAVVTPPFLKSIDELFIMCSQIGESYANGDRTEIKKAMNDYMQGLKARNK